MTWKLKKKTNYFWPIFTSFPHISGKPDFPRKIPLSFQPISIANFMQKKIIPKTPFREKPNFPPKIQLCNFFSLQYHTCKELKYPWVKHSDTNRTGFRNLQKHATISKKIQTSQFLQLSFQPFYLFLIWPSLSLATVHYYYISTSNILSII